MKSFVFTATLAVCLTSFLACKPAAPAAPAVSGGNVAAKPAKANPVVVVLDMDRLMGESNLSKGLHEELKAWAEAKQGELKARADAIQKAEAAKTKPAAEIEGMKRELFQMQEMAKQEFQQRQVEAAERMKKTFDPLVQSLAKENGWDVVLNKSEQLAIYTGDALDQTEFVLARLNVAPATAPAPAVTPAPAPAKP